MNIDLINFDKNNEELYFDIVDRDKEMMVGYIFTIKNHIVYEVYPEYRGQGIATKALSLITSRIDKPTLEITFNNMASKRVALKAGYNLVKSDSNFEIYEYGNTTIKR